MPLRPLVLIIDDENDHAEIVSLLLQRRGFVTATARDAASGLEAARRLRPSVVLLDLYLPGVDGFAVAEELAADERTNRLPIVFVSAVGAMLGERLGGRPTLEKPFRAAELYRAVERALTPTSRRAVG
jgi:CheY-like chemotaxis protein